MIKYNADARRDNLNRIRPSRDMGWWIYDDAAPREKNDISLV